ncbi:hypothetical protein ABIA69_001898 [Lysinibacillus parviboronicapiens]|uniref:Acb2/Tad1 hairpin domain-containing protein n=1 Tax=Lysinibacillus parviboronicapiens TaxID=436516 RepID=A0ABV2PIX7_9BACI
MNKCFVVGCLNKTETLFCSDCLVNGGVYKAKSNSTIENNFKYHSLKEGQQQKYEAIREKAKELAYLIDAVCPHSREKSVAMTNLETAVMWGNASIARNE